MRITNWGVFLKICQWCGGPCFEGAEVTLDVSLLQIPRQDRSNESFHVNYRYINTWSQPVLKRDNRKICNKNCEKASTDMKLRYKWRWTFVLQIYLTNQIHTNQYILINKRICAVSNLLFADHFWLTSLDYLVMNADASNRPCSIFHFHLR
jgi:hypothetical protein